MSHALRQLILATLLVFVPVALFTVAQIYIAKPIAVAQPASLGDLSPLQAIIADVNALALKGDLAGATKRIRDFEVAWDGGEDTLRPKNGAAWGAIDDAADAAMHALRSTKPDPTIVKATLLSLSETLADPYGLGTASSGVQKLAGIAFTDEAGHALACEKMLTSLKIAIDGGKIGPANLALAEELRTKALERCNADDDLHADQFTAQALSLSTP